MAELDSTEIVLTGVKHLEDWLKQNDYVSVAIDIWQEGSADIHANSVEKNILVQAKTVLEPTEQIPLNGTDKFALEDMAARLGRLPYVAYMRIDNNKNLIGDIIWEKLGK